MSSPKPGGRASLAGRALQRREKSALTSVMRADGEELLELPRDGFFAEGVAGQFMFVFSSADLVVARIAADDLGSDYWDEYAAGFLDRIFEALEP